MLSLSLVALLFLSSISLINARAEYRERIPNGFAADTSGTGIECEHLGHQDCVAGAPRLQFGLDFEDADLEWTKELCEKDSDGDGLTNGEELGDPCCVWNQGDTPTRVTELSHPGEPDETGAESAPKCSPTPSSDPSPASSAPTPSQEVEQNPASSSPSPVPSIPTVVTPTPEPNGEEDAVCFPAHATVTLEGGRVIEMQRLQIGDRVQVAQGVFSEVFMFTHKIADTEHEFVIIRIGNKNEVRAALTLTKGHLMYVNGRLERAGDVNVGDEVELVNGEKSLVAAVECAWFKGLYNPQTQHGDIIVDGVRVTTYTTTVKAESAHSLLAPLRIIYKLFGWSSSILEQGADRIVALLP